MQHGRHPVRQSPEAEAGPAEAAGQRAPEAEAAAAGQDKTTYLLHLLNVLNVVKYLLL